MKSELKFSLAWLAGSVVAILLTTSLIGLSVGFVESLVSPVLAYPTKAFQVMLGFLVIGLSIFALQHIVNIAWLLLPDDYDDDDDERELR
jgi:uncharacterized membrane protein YczE